MSTKNMMATDKVIEYFKDNVRKGIWKTGDKLPSEPELSELIGVGRSSVREAMKILESSHTSRSAGATERIFRIRMRYLLSSRCF